MLSRNYDLWMWKITDLLAFPKNQPVLRHDIDFDIKTVYSMMDIERRYGLYSIVYFDVNSPSYSMDDIKNLYNEFKDYYFLFGIHINVAYDYEYPNEGWNKYLENLKSLKEIIPVDSCVGHYYNPDMVSIPKYTNVDIERISNDEKVLPSFWNRFSFILGQDHTLLDSSGLNIHPYEWIESLPLDCSGFFSSHPVNYYTENDDVIYSKRFSKKPINDQDIIEAQKSIKDKVTPYLTRPITDLVHQDIALTWLKETIRKRYRELIKIIDAGCGIGLLGAHLQNFHNVKYIGVDMKKDFIDAGKEMFDKLGYAPKLICGNLYDGLPDGDILVYLAYEDCWTDYYKLFEICKNYKNMIISIVGKEMNEEAEKRGKEYNYIIKSDFEEIFSKGFTIKKEISVPQKRIIYWLERR